MKQFKFLVHFVFFSLPLVVAFSAQAQITKSLTLEAYITVDQTDGIRIVAEKQHYGTVYSSAVDKFNTFTIPFSVYSSQPYDLTFNQFSFECYHLNGSADSGWEDNAKVIVTLRSGNSDDVTDIGYTESLTKLGGSDFSMEYQHSFKINNQPLDNEKITQCRGMVGVLAKHSL